MGGVAGRVTPRSAGKDYESALVRTDSAAGLTAKEGNPEPSRLSCRDDEFAGN